ncbi:hypothetical protein P3T73_06030 [Kiritimatiellota bacterium B12222]|nr:hypothetical protein P3T73_06030 [Kiritimatiellota bacterium B12222]
MKDAYSPLFLAASGGDLETIKELSATATQEDLNRSLAQAAALNHFEAADHLIMSGAQADGDYDPLYGTVLFPACEYMNPEGIAWLLERGADPAREVLRIDGPRNALEHLLSSHHRSPLKGRCIQLLIKGGAPDPQDLPMAIHRGSLSQVQELLDKNPEALQQTLELPYGHYPLTGASLLHMAVEFNQGDIVKELLSRGMDVNQRAEMIPGTVNTTPIWPTDLVALGGQTPLFHAKGDSKEMLKLLLKHGANPALDATFLRDGKEIPLTALEFFEEIDQIECNLLEEILTLKTL